MKAKQSGGPAKLAHRCFSAYQAGYHSRLPHLAWVITVVAVVGLGRLSADTPKQLEDYAEVYVDQYFEPGAHLKLSEEARKKSRALAYFARGRFLEEQGQTDKAIAAFSEVLRNQPGQVSLARKTAYLLARAGRQEEARKLLEDTLAGNSAVPYAHLALSEYLATYEGHDPAGMARSTEIAVAAVKQFPGDASVYEHLVKLYLSTNRAEDARQLVTAASQLDNADAEFWLRLGKLAARVWPPSQGPENGTSPDLANQIHAKALSLANGKAAIIEQVGDYYLATGQFGPALEAYQRIIDAEPDRLDIREKLAQVYGASGDTEKLIETLKVIVDIDPQNAEVHKRIAGILIEQRDFKGAIPHLRSALAITKGSAEEYSSLANLMIQAKEFKAAEEFLKGAAHLFPDSPQFPFFLAHALHFDQRYADAIPYFEKTIELAKERQPDLLGSRFYFHYAAAHERHGDFAKAEELFRKTMELIGKDDPNGQDPGFAATVYNYLGYMWLENDMKIDEAGELIKTAAELDPESGAIADSLGWFYFKKGEYEKARDELLRAEESFASEEDEDAVIFDHLAQVYHALGDKEKAVSYMEKAVAKEPENEELKKRLDGYRGAAPAPPSATTPAPAASPKSGE